MNERLKEIRKSLTTEDGKKVSQEKFAEMLHVSRDVIANYESGRVELPQMFIDYVCKEFRVNETWLRTGTGEMFAPATRAQEIASITASIFKDDNEFRRNLIAAIAALDEEQINVLKEIAKKALNEK